MEITATQITGYIPLTVAFNYSEETITPVSVLWDMGDETTSTEESPNHTYEEEGTYTVTVTLTADDSSTETATIDITVDTPVAPSVSISAEPTTAYAPATIQFTAEVSGGEPADYEFNWDMGDGTNSIDQNPLHQYTAEGTYTAVLTVTNNGGNIETTETITIIISEPIYAVIRLKTEQTAQQTIKITNSTEYINIEPSSVLYNFGDGTSATATTAAGMRTQTHTYNSAGIYTITVSINYSNGYQHTSTIQAVLYHLNSPYNGIILNGQNYPRRIK